MNGRKLMWREVQRLRQAIRDEPLGGNRYGLRVKLLHVEAAHAEWMRLEQETKAANRERKALLK